MECKDCIHYSVCGQVDIDAPCASFEDKSKFIKSPCKVGDIVYRSCKNGNSVSTYGWRVIHTDFYGHGYTVYIDDSDNEFTDEDIGKTVFLTKEAEQSLKELNSK